MRRALRGGEDFGETATTLVARDADGNPVGAMTLVDHIGDTMDFGDGEEVEVPPYVTIDYVGTLGPGVGRDLVERAKQHAIDRKASLYAEPTETSLTYWTDTVGMTEDPDGMGTNFLGFTYEELSGKTGRADAPDATPEAPEEALPGQEEVPDVTLPEAGEADLGGPGEGGDPTPDFEGPVVAEAPEGASESTGLEGLPDFIRTVVQPGDKVYTHPQGSTIIVSAHGAVVKYGPDGKPRKTSADAAKLAAGHGKWEPVTASVAKPAPKPTAPPLEDKPATDFKPADAVVVASKPEPELPSTPAPAGSKHQVPMNFNEAPVAEVPKYIDDPNWFFQQKVDGIRGQLVIEPGKKPWFRSKSGDQLQSSTAAKITGPMLKQLGDITPEGGPTYTIDGELLDGKWYVFDMTVSGSESLPWEQRMKIAENWVNEVHKMGLKQVQALPTARTADEKRALWEAVNASGGEGVMMKRKDAPYQYGARVSHTLKAKITSTADVVVLERNIGGKENARIGIVVDGVVKPIGTVSMQGKEKNGKVEVGDIIEVEYLWAMPGSNALQQPRMVKKRPDKKPEDATDAQLRFVSKDVLDVGAGA